MSNILLLTLSLSILSLIVYRKKAFNLFFSYFSLVFENRENLGRLFGIRYVYSDEWSTTRETTKIAIAQPKFITDLIGFRLPMGDYEFIKAFRKRQRTPVRDFKIQLKSGKRSFDELEREVVTLWHNELKECYELPIEGDEEMIEGMLCMRKIVQSSIGNSMYGVYQFYKERETFRHLKREFSKLSDIEAALYIVPFLTTIDTFMISVGFKTYGQNLSDFFDKVPVKSTPMFEGDTPVIVKLVNNKANHPGNTVFGPTGVVCPGSNVTTQIIKAIKEFCNETTWEIEGTPIQNESGSIAAIINKSEVSITI
eukprot:TRINITY_DN2770_c0_g1_i1.p1 TRINITY_DN2770_c0_g1~~TRINITY_DN2770_c0_g1_i1.p1  ORF type:complete len:311 (+),score=50.76 TRINITY_DN2770_c0_g1_i1:48-980(+)